MSDIVDLEIHLRDKVQKCKCKLSEIGNQVMAFLQIINPLIQGFKNSNAPNNTISLTSHEELRGKRIDAIATIDYCEDLVLKQSSIPFWYMYKQ